MALACPPGPPAGTRLQADLGSGANAWAGVPGQFGPARAPRSRQNSRSNSHIHSPNGESQECSSSTHFQPQLFELRLTNLGMASPFS